MPAPAVAGALKGPLPPQGILGCVCRLGALWLWREKRNGCACGLFQLRFACKCQGLDLTWGAHPGLCSQTRVTHTAAGMHKACVLCTRLPVACPRTTQHKVLMSLGPRHAQFIAGIWAQSPSRCHCSPWSPHCTLPSTLGSQQGALEVHWAVVSGATTGHWEPSGLNRCMPWIAPTCLAPAMPAPAPHLLPAHTSPLALLLASKQTPLSPPFYVLPLGSEPLPSLAPSAAKLSHPRLVIHSLARTPARCRLLCQSVVWADTRSSDGARDGDGIN